MKTSTNIIIIDGGMMTDRRSAHDYLAARLDLPEYYGRNLDALHDCLTELGRTSLLVLYRPDVLREYLGDYGDALIDTLREAAGENPQLTFALDGDTLDI